MKRVFCLMIFLIVFTSSCFAASRTYQEDVNADQVKEKIVWKEFAGGNNLWGKLTISRHGKRVFESDELCLAYEGYGFLDIDNRYPGKELIIVSDTKIPGLRGDGRWADSFRSGTIYHWDKAKNTYVRYGLIRQTSRKYPALDTKGPIQDFRVQWPKIAQAIRIAEQFAKLAGQGSTSSLQPLLSRESSASITNIKSEASLFRQIPLSTKWTIDISPHDPNNVILVFPLKGDYGIFVVGKDGILSYGLTDGRNWD